MEGVSQKVNLIRELVLKDLKTRYARSSFGFFWAFLSPLFMVMVFYLVFGLILRVKIEDAPFVLYLMSGVFPWMFFQDSILKSVTSLMDNRNLIKESNFPHWLIPLSIVGANVVTFLPTILIFFLTSLVIGAGVSVWIVFLPLVIVIHIIMTAGLCIIVSLGYIRRRDLKYFLDSVLLLFFYLTPAVYPLTAAKASLPPLLFKLYMYNPLVGILTLYRTAMLKGFTLFVDGPVTLTRVIFIQILFAALIWSLAVIFYKKEKKQINDYLSY